MPGVPAFQTTGSRVRWRHHGLRILLLGLWLTVAACEVESQPPQGPAGTWWVGGADGGVFLKVTDDSDPNDDLYQGAVYFDSDQTLWYQGPLRLVGRGDFDPSQQDQYLGWDGERILLADGAYLQAVDPVPAL